VSGPLFVMGDVHGHLERTIAHIARAGLLGDSLDWAGRDATLWFVGDLVDRGPDGVGAIDLVRRLASEAAAAGGQVDTLLGNHDLLLLAAHRFGGSFEAEWRTGGAATDLERMSDERAAWLARRPALARAGEWLLAHADSNLYHEYGATVGAVNGAFARLAESGDATGVDRLLDQFGEHNAFRDRASARRFLDQYGGERVVHGHTPISSATGSAPARVTAPLVYADATCVNVDGGMYLGGPGFLARLDRWPDG
jgi:hypothetical protein